jgi:hypothetical protein
MNESTLILDPNIKAKVEAALGAEIPDPNSLEFQSFLEDLQSNRPDLFEEVMQGITVDIDFPAEQQAQKAARRENLYSLFKRTFFRRSAVDGEPVAAKRRWLMYTFGALAVLGPVLYLLGQSFGSGQDTAPPVEQTIVEPEPFEAVQPTAPLAQVQELPEEVPEPPPPPEPVQVPEPKRNTPPPPTPPRPVQAPAAPAQPAPAPPTPAPAATAAAPVVRPTTLSLYKQEVPPPPTMSVFDEKQTRETELLPLQIFNDESTSDTLLIAQTEDSKATALTIPIGETTNTTGRPTELQIDINEPDEAEGAGTVLPPPPTGLEPPDTATAPASESTAEASEGAEQTTEKDETLVDFLPAGSRLSARLTTGIAVTAGASTPVVATSDETWCTTPPCNEITWLGEATLDGSSRVQINFTQAVYKDNLQPVTALALGSGNTPGLTAAVKDTTPTLAQDILRSAVGGFSDYVNALQNQSTVTILDGVAVSETEAPPLDAFLLGRIGNLLALPQDNTPIVRVAEVAANTPIVVLFGVPSGGATPQEVQ